MQSAESNIDNALPDKNDVLKMLLDERDKHQAQILVMNGRFTFFVLVSAGGALVSGHDLHGITMSWWLWPSVVLFAVSTGILLWAMASHYLFHMEKIRFFEKAAQTCASTGRAPAEFTQVASAARLNPFVLVPPDRLWDFGHLVFYAIIGLLLAAVFFLVAVR